MRVTFTNCQFRGPHPQEDVCDHRIFDDGKAVFVVCDGHSGSACSSFTCENFIKQISEHVHNNGSLDASTMEATVERVVDAWEKEELDTSGSTLCAVAVDPTVEGTRLLVCNLGDSRAAWIDIGSDVVTMSVDHTPSPSGSYALDGQAYVHLQGRVQGVLAMTHSVGDNCETLRGCIHRRPSVHTVDLRNRPHRVLLATDGFWDDRGMTVFQPDMRTKNARALVQTPEPDHDRRVHHDNVTLYAIDIR